MMGTSQFNSMQLVRYEPLTDSRLTFCAPLYTAKGKTNQIFSAVPEIEGDELSRISAFRPVIPSNGVRDVSQDIERDVAIGEEWVDLLLFDGELIVGTRQHIAEVIQPHFEALLGHFPLTLIDVFRSQTGSHRKRAIAAAYDLLIKVGGEKAADRWAVETHLRSMLLTHLRRKLVAANASMAMFEAIRSMRVEVENSSKELILKLPHNGTLLSKTDLSPIESLSKDSTVLNFIAELPGGLSKPSISLRLPVETTEWEYIPDPILLVPIGRAASVTAKAVRDKYFVKSQWPRKMIETGKYENLESNIKAKKYSIVILLLDEKSISKKNLFDMRELAFLAQSRDVPPLLLAPLLPSTGPSYVLNQPGAFSDFKASGGGIVLDTSFVRSPLWNGDPSLSVNRRAMDHAIKAALCMISEVNLTGKILELLAEEPNSLLTLSRRDERNSKGRLEQYCTEGASFDLYETRSLHQLAIAETSPNLRRADHDGSGLYELNIAKRRIGGFDELAVLSVEKAMRTQVSESSPGDTLSWLRDPLGAGLDYPDLAASVIVHTRDGRTKQLIVTAEAPTLTAIIGGQNEAAQVVRYTDETSIRRSLAPNSYWENHLPGDFVHLDRSSLRLKREVFFEAQTTVSAMVPKDVWKKWSDIYRQHPLAKVGWDLVLSTNRFQISPENSVAFLPEHLDALQELRAPGTEELKSLFEKYDVSTRNLKILTSHNTVKSHGNEIFRWVFRAGKLPIVPRILPERMAVHEGWLGFDGDVFSAAVVASDLFNIWVRGHQPARTWGGVVPPRSDTLSIFPWPSNFEVGGDRKGIRLVAVDPKFEDLVRNFDPSVLNECFQEPYSARLKHEISAEFRTEVARLILQYFGVPDIRTEAEALVMLRQAADSPIRPEYRRY